MNELESCGTGCTQKLKANNQKPAPVGAFNYRFHNPLKTSVL